MITKTELTERWSAALIKKFTPIIVKERKNIYGGITKYYSLKEIKLIEKSEAFKNEYEKTLKRKSVAKERSIKVEKKLREAKQTQFVDNLIIDLPSKERLIDEVICHHNLHNRHGYVADRGCDENFLLRITQNYVRHMCSNYDYILICFGNGKYKNDAYEFLKEHINDRVERFLAS